MGAPGQGGMPQQLGNTGFNAPPGIPVSPFVETFAGSKPGGPNPPQGIPGMGPPMNNPFGGGAGAPSGFGQNKPMPPLGNPGSPMGGGFPSAYPGAPGNPPGPQSPLQGGPANPGSGFGQGGGFGNAPGGFGSPGGFGAPGPGAGFTPMPNPMGAPPSPGSAFQTPPGKGGPPYPGLQVPNMPPQSEGEMPPQGRSLGGMEDNSGIVTTYEDMAKDDSFKTKKLPHPNEKKKGFFDGLFKKEK
jgi:hypothetical protein